MDSDDDNFFDAEDAFDDGGPSSLGAGQLHPSVEVPGARTSPTVVAKPSTEGASDDPPQGPFPLHRAAWYGQVDLVQRLAAGMTREELKAHDSQGNTALHVAVMRRQAAVVSALLAAGCPAGPRNARGWVPMMEAVELGDRELALQLAKEDVAQMRAAVKSKKQRLLGVLRSQLPDFSLQLRWELGSAMPGVGALVRRYAPHDTYTLWKKGGRIRVDGTLMGLDDGSGGASSPSGGGGPSLLPAWKRGAFSLLYDASGAEGRGRALFVNHTKKTYIDIKAARKQLGGDEGGVLEAEVDCLMTSEVLQHKKLRSDGFRFKPVSGWLSREVWEKVEGWRCRLYEAAGRLVAVSQYKMPYGLTPDMSYDDYLAASFDSDPVVMSPVNPLNPATLKDRGMNPEKAAAKAAVAAKHQRIAAAAAAAKNEEAARVARAAAARAAAGARRALTPRVYDDDDDSEDEGEEAGRRRQGAGEEGDEEECSGVGDGGTAVEEEESSGGGGGAAGGKQQPQQRQRRGAACPGGGDNSDGGGGGGGDDGGGTVVPLVAARTSSAAEGS
ncbi:hypothetical protein Agub_g11366, partial [Astrephomene gubernaculifera]